MGFSVSRSSSELEYLSMQRLVQSVLKDGMDRDTQRLWAERCIRATNRAFPEVDLQTWEECQRCLPHVLICALYIKEYELAFSEAARLFNKAAAYLVDHARYEQAKSLLQQPLLIRH